MRKRRGLEGQRQLSVPMARGLAGGRGRKTFRWQKQHCGLTVAQWRERGLGEVAEATGPRSLKQKGNHRRVLGQLVLKHWEVPC